MPVVQSESTPDDWWPNTSIWQNQPVVQKVNSSIAGIQSDTNTAGKEDSMNLNISHEICCSCYLWCPSVWIRSLEDVWMDYIEKHYSLFNLLAIDNNKTGLLGFVYKPFNHQTTVQKKGTSQSKAWTDCVQSNFLQFFVFKKKFFFWSFMLKRSFLKAKQKKKTQ